MVFGHGWDTWSWTLEMNEGTIFSLPSLLWRPTPSSLIPGPKRCFGSSSPNFEQGLGSFAGSWFAGGGQRSRTAGTLQGVGDTEWSSWTAPEPRARCAEPTGTRLAVTVMEAKPLCWLGRWFALGQSDGDMVSSKDVWISNWMGSTKNVLLMVAEPWSAHDGFVGQALGWGIRACMGRQGWLPLHPPSSVCAVTAGEINAVFWEGRDSCKWRDSQLSSFSIILCATVSHPPSTTAGSFVQDLLLTFYS